MKRANAALDVTRDLFRTYWEGEGYLGEGAKGDLVALAALVFLFVGSFA